MKRHWLGSTAGMLGMLQTAVGIRRKVCVAYHDIPVSSLTNFRRQLEALRAHYRPLSLAEFMEAVTPGMTPDTAGILISFDDVFATQYRAAEILAELGIRGVFFVPVGFPSCETPAQWDEYIVNCLFAGRYPRTRLPAGLRPMTWDQLRQIQDWGHEIGAHTVTHPNLGAMTNTTRIMEEVAISGNLLEQKLGGQVEAFAFPFGSIKHICRPALQAARQRYPAVFTSVRGGNRSDMGGVFTRETISPDDPVDYVLFQAAGGLSPYYWRDRRLLAQMAREGCS